MNRVLTAFTVTGLDLHCEPDSSACQLALSEHGCPLLQNLPSRLLFRMQPRCDWMFFFFVSVELSGGRSRKLTRP
jgi:hypothetical protein